MRATAVAATALGLLLWSGPAAAARNANYDLTEDQFAELSESLKASGFRPMVARGDVDVVLENPEAADHRLAILGISCRAWHVDNSLSQMVRRTLTAWDKDGDLAAVSAAAIRLRIESASSTMRCVQVKELKMRCLVTMSLEAQAARTIDGAERLYKVAIDVRQEQKMSGACNGLAQGSSLIGRTASLALVDRLTEIAADQ